MKKKVALLLALIMVFALFAAGCGSSDDGEGITKDEAENGVPMFDII